MKPELVYSSSFSLKDVVQDGEDCLEDKSQKNTDGTNQLTRDTENPIYQTAKMIKAGIKKCQGISLYPLNVNDITLTTSKKIVHCTSHGQKKLRKHISLAMSVRHLTGSKEIVTMLNRMGNCSSYDEI